MADRKRAYVENFDLYSDGNKIILDFVGRYETLAADFASVLAKLGLAGEVALPRANESRREGDYRGYYDERTKALVAKWYEREIKRFGYEF
jgi:hypothetical protein